MTFTTEEITNYLTDFSQQNDKLLKLQHQLTIAQQKLTTGDWAEWETEAGLKEHIEQLIAEILKDGKSEYTIKKAAWSKKIKYLETEQDRLNKLLTSYRRIKQDLETKVGNLKSQLQDEGKLLTKWKTEHTKFYDGKGQSDEKQISELTATIDNLETELAKKELEIADFQEQLIILNRKKPNTQPFFTKELLIIAGVVITAYFLLK